VGWFVIKITYSVFSTDSAILHLLQTGRVQEPLDLGQPLDVLRFGDLTIDRFEDLAVRSTHSSRCCILQFLRGTNETISSRISERLNKINNYRCTFFEAIGLGDWIVGFYCYLNRFEIQKVLNSFFQKSFNKYWPASDRTVSTAAPTREDTWRDADVPLRKTKEAKNKKIK